MFSLPQKTSFSFEDLSTIYLKFTSMKKYSLFFSVFHLQLLKEVSILYVQEKFALMIYMQTWRDLSRRLNER